MKLNKKDFSKAEFQSLMRERSEKKRQKKLAKLYQNKTTKYNILCLKHGTKYNSHYVNVLYNMIQRNLIGDFNLYCLTEDPKGIDERIHIIPLPNLPLFGWWYKPYIFSAEIPIIGTILFFDLDIIISSNINKLFDYAPNKCCILRDFIKLVRPSWNRYNSSIIRYNSKELDFVWQTFINNHQHYMRKYHGDQDFLFEVFDKKATYWPDAWIKSWKWEIRKSKQVNLNSSKGKRKFLQIENVVPNPECCIQVFHGDPNPHNCDDPFIIKHWK
tara:strand:- start:373 stop:1188 length:816 start_codon:yes stop_codon:yes gene_type:complete